MLQSLGILKRAGYVDLEEKKMKKLVENIKEYERVEFNGKPFLITDIYKTDGESVEFISTDDKGKEFKFSIDWGTVLTVLT